jgi:outer membrane protein assembly factor BamB
MRHALVCGLAAALGMAFTIQAAEPANGWRGNGTGLWPDSQAPTEWSRIPHGALEGMRNSAEKPATNDAGDAPLIRKGLVCHWQALGPFDVPHPVQDFDLAPAGDESTLEPAPGKIADREWNKISVPEDDMYVFGAAELPWLNLGKALDSKSKQIAYAHTYVHSPRGGRARIVAEHFEGMKAWVNGREVYRHPERGAALGYFTQLSILEIRNNDGVSPHFDVDLRPGWNRLLVKLSTSHIEGLAELRCSLRINDPVDVAYESKNIVWMTPLPGRSTSTPILVGDRLFVLAEPDELLCLDKGSGRVLWSRTINYLETVTADERAKNPAFAARIDPLVAKLRAESDPLARVRLRADLQKALNEIDKDRFEIDANDHFEAHFAVVGYTMPTPVSDGKHVYVWSGLGIAACFDLDGNRQWITRVKTDHLTYGSSPALADGMLVVYLNQVYGLDAATGKLVWEQPRIRNNVAALLGATLGGQQVVVTQRGDVIRPKDGELLVRLRGSEVPNDIGWAPPVILGNRVYTLRYGVAWMLIRDYTHVERTRWQPEVVADLTLAPGFNLKPDGNPIERWTAASPLVWDDILYSVDIYQTLYATDLKSGKMLYRQDLDLDGLMHYNAVPVAASPTLIGKNIVVLDNQGTAVVVKPGPTFQQVARNRLATQLERRHAIPAQETACYAPPIVDGDRIFLRGEAYLYCIGAK